MKHFLSLIVTNDVSLSGYSQIMFCKLNVQLLLIGSRRQHLVGLFTLLVILGFGFRSHSCSLQYLFYQTLKSLHPFVHLFFKSGLRMRICVQPIYTRVIV